MSISAARIFFLASLASAGFSASADEAPESRADAAATAPAAPTPRVKAEIDGYLRLAAGAIARDNLTLAETFFQRLLSVDVPDVLKEPALLQMADLYEKQHAVTKTIAALEKVREFAPDDPRIPEILLRLGRLYRESGAYETAISRYYSILNAALKINERKFAQYRDWTQQAQFEIAETYFAAGKYAQANKFFSLLGKLDLGRDDKARALFRSTYCLYLLGDKLGAEVSARSFLKDFADTKSAPECRFLLAMTLKSLNRAQETIDEVLALLRAEKSIAEKDPKTWAYWQQKTGNQIANEFYQQGDFVRAITIYQSLAKLNAAPDWRWPVIYQMGLCFERLRLQDRAMEAYKFIIDDSKKPHDGNADPDTTGQIVKMAQWRSEQLGWQQQTDVRLQSLLGGQELPDDVKVTSIP